MARSNIFGTIGIFGLLLVQALAQRQGGRRDGGGGRGICDDLDNIDSWECEDGQTYVGLDDVKDNCGRIDRPVSCKCLDRSSWTTSERRQSERSNNFEIDVSFSKLITPINGFW